MGVNTESVYGHVFLKEKRNRSGFFGKIENMELVRECYVYSIVVDGVVRYIGKGRNKRLTEHLTIARRLITLRSQGRKVRGSLFYNKLAKAIATGCVVDPQVIANGLTDDEAYDLERQEISSREGLWNLFAGGRGSTRDDCLKAWDNPERRARHVATMAAHGARPDVRQRMSEGVKRWLSQPGVAEARRQSQAIAAKRPESRAKKGAISRARWSDPDNKAKYRASLDRPSTRKKMSESAKRRVRTPEEIAKMVATRRAQLADPAERERYRQRAIAAGARPEVKAKLSAASKARWADPEYRARVIASQKLSRERPTSVDGHN